MSRKNKIVILHNIRSAYNVGSVFRTAEAAGVEEVILTGYSPTPVDRFGDPRKDISKTALGAEKVLKWSSAKDAGRVIKKLKQHDYKTTAVEQDEKAIDYKKLTRIDKRAFIFGNEVKGLSKNLLSYSDEVVEIPMAGKKESLNVSVAVGIILFNTK